MNATVNVICYKSKVLKKGLTKFNIAAKEVKGSHYGNSYCGIVYFATDNDDNKVGNPFSAATLGKFAGSEALAKKYQTSKEHLEKSRPTVPLKRAINQAFAGATNKEQLRYNLFQNCIGVVYRENATGRLYGVTFIDHNTGVVLNGSRLGKEYAANAIVDRLENPRQYEHLTNNPQSQGSAPFAPQQQPLRSQEIQPIHRTEQHLESSSIATPSGHSSIYRYCLMATTQKKRCLDEECNAKKERTTNVDNVC